jgi:DNA repair photolyase
MRVIYEPRGRAKEYSDLACNLFTGCSHACKYCYAPAIRRQTLDTWSSTPAPRKHIIEALAKDCEDMRRNPELSGREILFCFMSDPYQSEEAAAITRKALEIVTSHGQRCQVLTKGGMRASDDFRFMAQHGIKFGSTIIFADDRLRRSWEPGATPIEERLYAVKQAHELGVYTWVSIEPVINPDEALAVINALSGYVNLWKIGKINHNKAVEDSVDWAEFLTRVTALLEKEKADLPVGLGDYYIKKDLRRYGAAGENAA